MIYEKIKSHLEKLKSENNYRRLKPSIDIDENKNKYINLSSNDYLSISKNKEILEEFYSKYKESMSGCSSRLMIGNHKYYIEYEEKLESLYNKPALLLNSGYTANVCLLNTLYNKNDLIIMDKLNHASLYDGVNSSGATLKRYKHLDYDNLEEILKKEKDNYENILIVSETVFSMDGDEADIPRLVEIKQKYGVQLFIDEAHTFGVRGKDGLGLVKDKGLIDKVDFIMCGLGKAGSSNGGFLIIPQIVKEYIINKGRELIFTTAEPEMNVAWNVFVLDIILKSDNEREKLKENSIWLGKQLKDKGYNHNSTSNIFPIIIGDEKKCLEISNYLRENGFYVSPINYPTVPRGTSRLRVSLNSSISKDNLKNFLELIQSI